MLFKGEIKTRSPDHSLGWTVPEQGGGSVFQPKHAVLHHTESQCLRDLSLEKGALKVVCCNEDKTMDWEDLFEDKQRMNVVYVWCMMFWGQLLDSKYTGTLQNCLRKACVHCECLWLAHWSPGRKKKVTDRTNRWWGRYQCCWRWETFCLCFLGDAVRKLLPFCLAPKLRKGGVGL